MIVAPLFSLVKSHSQNIFTALKPENTLSFGPHFEHFDQGVTKYSMQELHTLWATHKFDVCSIEPHHDFLQLTQMLFESGKYPSQHSSRLSCVHS